MIPTSAFTNGTETAELATNNNNVVPPAPKFTSSAPPPLSRHRSNAPPPGSSNPNGIDTSKYRTKPCRNYLQGIECPFAERCAFAHGPPESEKPNAGYIQPSSRFNRHHHQATHIGAQPPVFSATPQPIFVAGHHHQHHQQVQVIPAQPPGTVTGAPSTMMYQFAPGAAPGMQQYAYVMPPNGGPQQLMMVMQPPPTDMQHGQPMFVMHPGGQQQQVMMPIQSQQQPPAVLPPSAAVLPEGTTQQQ